MQTGIQLAWVGIVSWGPAKTWNRDYPPFKSAPSSSHIKADHFTRPAILGSLLLCMTPGLRGSVAREKMSLCKNDTKRKLQLVVKITLPREEHESSAYVLEGFFHCCYFLSSNELCIHEPKTSADCNRCLTRWDPPGTHTALKGSWFGKLIAETSPFPCWLRIPFVVTARRGGAECANSLLDPVVRASLNAIVSSFPEAFVPEEKKALFLTLVFQGRKRIHSLKYNKIWQT